MKSKHITPLLFLFITTYFVAFSILSILKHQALHSTYLDLGLQSQSVWNTSRGRILEISFGKNGELMSQLGDHISPITIFLAPLYRIWPDPVLLLLIQTLVLALGALPIYWLAKDVLCSRHSGKLRASRASREAHPESGFWTSQNDRDDRRWTEFLSLAFAVSYLLYPSTQYANLFDFHPETLATTLLLFTFWFLHKKRYKLFLLFAFLSILCKENIAFVVAMMGLYEVFRINLYKLVNGRIGICKVPFVVISSFLGKTSAGSVVGPRPNVYKFTHGRGRFYKVLCGESALGILVFIFSVFWFLGCVYVIIPHFSGGEMGAVGRYGWLGSTPLEIIKNFISHPIRDLKVLLMVPKIKYVFHLLVSVGFLPIFAPQYLALALPEFWLNLFSEYNPMWQVKFHYTSAITPFVFIAAIFGVRFFLQFCCCCHSGNPEFSGASRILHVFRFWTGQNDRRRELLVGVYLIAISLFWNFMHSPSPLYRKFDYSVFKVTPEARQTREILKQIPLNASVSAMNNLGPHLSNRRYLYRFPIGISQSDYIVVDPKMPAENFDYAQISEEEFEDLMRSREIVNNYQEVTSLERLLVLKRKEP